MQWCLINNYNCALVAISRKLVILQCCCCKFLPGQHQDMVDVPNKLGQTALHEAAKRGHVAIAAALIFAGAAVDAPDRWNKPPLQPTSAPCSCHCLKMCLFNQPQLNMSLNYCTVAYLSQTVTARQCC